MTKTPRTDKEQFEAYTPALRVEVVKASFARQLEAELNQWKSCAEELARQNNAASVVGEASRQVEVSDALYRKTCIERDDLRRQVESWKEAHDIISQANERHANQVGDLRRQRGVVCNRNVIAPFSAAHG